MSFQAPPRTRGAHCDHFACHIFLWRSPASTGKGTRHAKHLLLWKVTALHCLWHKAVSTGFSPEKGGTGGFVHPVPSPTLSRGEGMGFMKWPPAHLYLGQSLGLCLVKRPRQVPSKLCPSYGPGAFLGLWQLRMLPGNLKLVIVMLKRGLAGSVGPATISFQKGRIRT